MAPYPFLCISSPKLAPDIHQRFQTLEAGPQTSQNELVNLAFRVFNNRDEEKAHQERQREEAKAKSHDQAYQLRALALKWTQDFPQTKWKNPSGDLF